MLLVEEFAVFRDLREAADFGGMVVFEWGFGRELLTGERFGLEFAEAVEGLAHGVFGFPRVFLDIRVSFGSEHDHRVKADFGPVGVEVLFGETAAFEFPGAFEDAFEEDLLEGSGGGEGGAEAGFELFKFGFAAGEDDETAGGQVVSGGVAGRGGFAGFGAGSGGVDRVGAVGGHLFVGCHFVSFAS